jgi:hypothetical protein
MCVCVCVCVFLLQCSCKSSYVRAWRSVHGVLPPLASPTGGAVRDWYPWAVICSHVCALLAHVRVRAFAPCQMSLASALTYASRPCACVCTCLNTHSPLSTSSLPDNDAPNDARHALTLVCRSTLDVLISRPIDRRSTQLDTYVRASARHEREFTTPIDASCDSATPVIFNVRGCVFR